MSVTEKNYSLYKNPCVNDMVMTVLSKKIGKVIEVSNQWGWFKIEFLNDVTKIFSMGDEGTSAVRKLTTREEADLFLQLENSRITDNWSED